MLRSKNIAKYLVFESESIIKALEKINANQNRIVFVVSENGELIGSLSDGDFRRWVTNTVDFDVQKNISVVMNKNVRYELVTAEDSEIESMFKDGIEIVPLIDKSRRLMAVAFENQQGFSIGKDTISENSPAYIIAEIGNNHNGDIKLAKQLVDLALESGADCVKFQMRDLQSLFKHGDKDDACADLGAQYTLDLLKKFQLTNDELVEVFDYCKSKKITPLCTPWDLQSLKFLESYGMEVYKVASADFTNHELLGVLVNTHKPLICSTGMSTEFEIKKSIDFLQKRGANFVLLHCNSAYPAPFKDVNLAYMNRLKDLSGSLVGYSGHERGISVPIAAVALGAKIIEKHFTVDKEMEGNDHKVSLLPEEFSRMVTEIRSVEEAMGSASDRKITQGEMLNRETLAKSVVINQTLRQGETITRQMLSVKSPGQGLQPLYLEELVGKKAKRDLKTGDYFFESDLTEDEARPREYAFNRPFGIPVRYHDYQRLSNKSTFTFLEFHLSYQDMKLDLSDYFSGPQENEFAVHSPELFENDHILNLTSDCEDYRACSIGKLQDVCDLTRSLKKYFPKTEAPLIVVNAGGFSNHGFLEKVEIPSMYELVAKSLQQIDKSGVEIIIQTMPPYPWHFGGQRYHNLFVHPEEIKLFCEEYGYRICFDTSHSMMACNLYNLDFKDFTQIVSPFIAHMHIADALSVDGEGIQIGCGDINFEELASCLRQYAPNAMFLPEIWQGHKNDGEGFWNALQFLEKYEF